MKRNYTTQQYFCSLSLLHGVLLSFADTKHIALCTAQAHIILLPSNDQFDRTEGRKSPYYKQKCSKRTDLFHPLRDKSNTTDD